MLFHFSDYILDTSRRELRCGDQSIEVEPQVLDLLIYLMQNHDRVVSKDDLIASVWGGRIVSDTTLTSRIYAARRAIGDSGRNQKLIRTIARKGLRFIGDVRMQADDDSSALQPIRRSTEAARLAQPAPPLPDRPAIAVLPFNNMSGDPEQEYFSDGISEDIITALSKLRWFFVIARNSSFMYKGKAVHVKQIGEELGVGYVLEGSVRKSGGARPHHRAAQRCRQWQPCLGGTLRPRCRRRVRRAGRDHRGHRGGDRAAAICGGKHSHPAQAAEQSRRLGSGDAGAVILLAGDAAGSCHRAGPAEESHCH